jgi:hypothetical protein
MKLIVRISALTLVVVALASGGSASKTSVVASNLYSSVPGGGGPMPSCNPFTSSNCPPIR